MNLHRLPVLLPVLVLPLTLLAQPKKPPYREKKAALELFNDEFVALTPGKGKFPAAFTMGSGADGPREEKPAREVKFARGFAIARYEVTQELYQSVMGKNPAKWQGPRNSVEMVSYSEALEFCKKATEEMRRLKLITAEEEIRLPTEAEWEYSCRAGTTTPFSFDDIKNVRDFCWYKDNSPGNDPPVGSKKGNPWGIHEMHGYVWEWVMDSWHPSYEGAPADGTARLDRDAKQFVVRGGGFNSPVDRCRSAAREGRDVNHRNDALGFRCVKATMR